MAKLHSLRFSTALHAIAFTVLFHLLSGYLQADSLQLSQPLARPQSAEWIP
ncbi:MAG: hypothetical protein HC886_12170 [Leptolyngbyaceae cyanobacterium SM1_1_3]|nr:hypothetical protein [Leptolyngbyaceae cyanobacterium SM1_1_3]NJN02201.1 hypothetical protein [Leptolyngbyaceae cyanobacterium RM1_1_2]NJO10353.1 hypothetical protein [Leptolyngbyaceae cyanobacterium SL_1_1]